MANILNSLSRVKRPDIVLSVRDIKKIFMEGGQPLHVLTGGGFDLAAGEIVALVGQSGSGKSTLLHIAGLLDTPTAGTIEIAGQNATKMSDAGRTKLRQKTIGFVYQSHLLLPDDDPL